MSRCAPWGPVEWSGCQHGGRLRSLSSPARCCFSRGVLPPCAAHGLPSAWRGWAPHLALIPSRAAPRSTVGTSVSMLGACCLLIGVLRRAWECSRLTLACPAGMDVSRGLRLEASMAAKGRGPGMVLPAWGHGKGVLSPRGGPCWWAPKAGEGTAVPPWPAKVGCVTCVCQGRVL